MSMDDNTKKFEITIAENGFILKYFVRKTQDTPQWQDEWVESVVKIFKSKEDLFHHLGGIL